MSSGLDDRKDSFEAKFKHDQELQFKCAARAAKLFGLWASEKLGLSGADAEAYAQQVVESDFESAGHEDVIRKVKHDLDGKGINLEESLLNKEYLKFLEDAKQQIATAIK